MMHLQQFVMHGSSSEELVLPVNLERSTCVAVCGYLTSESSLSIERHTAEFA